MMGIRSLDCVRINWVPRPRNLGIGHGGLNATGFALALLALLIGSSAFGQQLDPVTKWATDTSYQSTIHQNIIYQKAGSQNLRLDVIAQKSHSGARPVVIYFHGGGWVSGGKDGVLLKTLPYIARGMDAVNVEYRLASDALAPAAVEDCRCALYWVVHHAKEYGFDTMKIVTTGESAGGHLALMTGMLSPAEGFDNGCDQLPDAWQDQGPIAVRVAAIVNYFGPIDVFEFLQPSNGKKYAAAFPMPRNFALRWFGDVPNRTELARRLSPSSYVRKETPPIITVQGDLDPQVPYEHAVRFHQALDRSSIQNQLVTIHGGHGAYSDHAWTTEQNRQAQEAVFQFLEKVGVLTP